jgi:hypothetical protein
MGEHEVVHGNRPEPAVIPAVHWPPLTVMAVEVTFVAVGGYGHTLGGKGATFDEEGIAAITDQWLTRPLSAQRANRSPWS